MIKKIIFMSSLAAFSACIKNDVYNAESNIKIPVNDYFDFNTSSDIKLSINYGYEDYSVPFAVYTENPYDEYGVLREDAKEPIFGAFTDKNTTFESSIKMPSHIEKVYVCSEYIGIPRVLELDVNNNNISYIYQPENITDTKSTRADVGFENECHSIGSNYSTLNGSSKMYGLYNSYSGSTYIPSNSKNSKIYSQINNNTYIADGYTIGSFLNNIRKVLGKKDNSKYCADSRITNLRIANYSDKGNKIESAHIDLIFLNADGGYSNAMGYYYYKSDANLTPEEIKALPKYMVYPRTTTGKPGSKLKARLQYFGENYNEFGVDHFPAGYTIGWVLVADIAGYENDKSANRISSTASLSSVNPCIVRSYNNGRGIYSNKECNPYQNYGCITLTDTRSGKIVIGFEDQAYKKDCGDKSYEDILFYVDCDPIEAIYDPERPELEEPLEEEEILKSSTKVSTYAFEDVWPEGGDYDMNDLVIEHTQTITFNQFNKIKKIVDSFKAAHCGATFVNGFGFMFNGSINKIEDESTFFDREADNQFVMFGDFKEDISKVTSIVRTFGDEGVNMLAYNTSINPFAIPNYIKGAKNRKEVHLPKSEPSSWADLSLLGQGRDAYYLDVDGLYPFAIELFDIKDWKVVTERSKIGSEGEYPRYNSWVQSRGAKDSDWYLTKDK